MTAQLAPGMRARGSGRLEFLPPGPAWCWQKAGEPGPNERRGQRLRAAFDGELGLHDRHRQRIRVAVSGRPRWPRRRPSSRRPAARAAARSPISPHRRSRRSASLQKSRRGGVHGRWRHTNSSQPSNDPLDRICHLVSAGWRGVSPRKALRACGIAAAYAIAAARGVGTAGRIAIGCRIATA